MQRQILAAYDSEGIYVYQAFKPSIAEEALRKGTFGKGFNMERMTWIKPSFGWMLYRSGYATKHRQESILKIKLTHEGFQEILKQAIPTSFDRDIFASERDWKRSLDKSEVRYQWDPDRDLSLRRLEHRALQLGIRGSVVQSYANNWIIKVEEVTQLARDIQNAIKNKSKEMPQTPEEKVLQVSKDIEKFLRITHENSLNRY
ncbi:hypothetical protein Riv7116_5353 [Rivularia sp. PCC 7116]|uniref:DUF4291 domain-containing protein n=1 Tax=Rivularia sp. PCC 7116 TaxID=373994 RepID=UPI00029F2DA7|nr:DUF4291 domain-containing protein [Rivularia sp. PCC 7116]AFY57733.1 hypothetical protein Riv7116_5353 [Rivularia sp. PCC 7116]